ncbi:MAG: pantoate--beta-alanine ligase [Rickettsiales bacterium]|nr:pantoate--beta-alanine ligase [Rickettsiales bacterium]
MTHFIDTPLKLREHCNALSAGAATIGLVPTMGALHAGHISLVRLAKQQCSHVIVSIFVNPTQFGPNEDYERYPRTLEKDKQLLELEGIDAIYAPSAQHMYPEGFNSTIHLGGMTEILCGASRPGHFDGVTTIVCKLLNQSGCHKAFFGEKDFQQLCVIKQMVNDLDMPVEIIGGHIIREASGLALSSRNQYLTEVEHTIASTMNHELIASAEKLHGGEPIENTLQNLEKTLLGNGFNSVEYVELRDSITLEPVQALVRPARLLAAVKLGNTRLIDNVEVTP